MVLLTAEGAHVPAIPLLEVAGNRGAVLPLHIAAGMVKSGVTLGVTVIVVEVVVAHNPAEGVNV